jgi:hypothetical protein
MLWASLCITASSGCQCPLWVDAVEKSAFMVVLGFEFAAAVGRSLIDRNGGFDTRGTTHAAGPKQMIRGVGAVVDRGFGKQAF